MSRKTVVRLSRATARWLDNRNRKDRERADATASGMKRFIDFWEHIRSCSEWTAVIDIGDNYADRRWMRRNLYTLESAGFVETRKVTVVAADKGPLTRVEFRRRKR